MSASQPFPLSPASKLTSARAAAHPPLEPARPAAARMHARGPPGDQSYSRSLQRASGNGVHPSSMRDAPPRPLRSTSSGTADASRWQRNARSTRGGRPGGRANRDFSSWNRRSRQVKLMCFRMRGRSFWFCVVTLVGGMVCCPAARQGTRCSLRRKAVAFSLYCCVFA